MNDHRPPGDEFFPEGWDRLPEHEEAPVPSEEVPVPRLEPVGGPPSEPTILGLTTAAWADLVAMLGPCAAILVALRAGGYPVGLATVPWAGALALAWWLLAAGTLLTVRRGTPGMLLAGMAFSEARGRGALRGVLLLQALSALTLGLPAVLLYRFWGPRLELVGPEAGED